MKLQRGAGAGSTGTSTPSVDQSLYNPQAVGPVPLPVHCLAFPTAAEEGPGCPAPGEGVSQQLGATPQSAVTACQGASHKGPTHVQTWHAVGYRPAHLADEPCLSPGTAAQPQAGAPRVRGAQPHQAACLGIGELEACPFYSPCCAAYLTVLSQQNRPTRSRAAWQCGTVVPGELPLSGGSRANRLPVS